MKIPLPNLDDRLWADLVDEGRSLIPVYAPDWTDHNVHDPGITLMEMFAWIAEMDIYRLNRITDEHRRKFLSLVGITPNPPSPARAVLGLTLIDGVQSLKLRVGTEFAGNDSFGVETQFRSLHPVTVAPGRIEAIQVKDAKGFHNVTDSWKRGEPVGVFGALPETGAELYLGFSAAFPPGKPVSLFFVFAGSRSGEDERYRLIEEAKARKHYCRPPAWDIACETKKAAHIKMDDGTEKIPPRHRVRKVWEFYIGKDKWLLLDPKLNQVTDDTRSLTLSGQIELRVPELMAKSSIGDIKEELYYLRCRFEAGAYDAPPIIRTVIMNGVAVEQAMPVPMKFIIRSGVVVKGPEPKPGRRTAMRLRLDAQGQISDLIFEEGGNDKPKFRALEFERPSLLTKGSLTLEAAYLGSGDGTPNQELTLPITPAQESSFQLFSLEKEGWHVWTLVRDFDNSKRDERHFLLEPTDGVISFGDGENGIAPQKGALFFAIYRATRAELGNLAARAISRLADSPHNRARLKRFDKVKNRLREIKNPLAAVGGDAAETIDDAAGRAIKIVNETRRAVTLKDYEELAMKTPGAQLARATALANLHPSFPCFKATGIITLIILPDMPVARPMPSPGLRQAVAAYLNRRRVIGTRVEVVGPGYLEVAVRARVKALTGASKSELIPKITEALNDFLDPLKGGPERTGWPFGRDVYRSEIMQIIDEVAGVDHVLSLDLIAEGCDPQCSNICLPPTWLVAAGLHEIEVI